MTNPGGESLPSNVIRVKVPPVDGISVRLEFDDATTDNVVAYRIYRTSAPDALSTDVRLHAQVTAASICNGGSCAYVDAGAATTLPMAQQTAPLTVGTFGKWARLADLPQARFGVQLAVMPANPSNPADTRVAMFAIGGRDSTSIQTAVYRSIVSVTSPATCTATARCTREAHSLSAWATDAPLPVGRAFGAARTIATADFSSLPATLRLIVMGSGITADNSNQGDQADPVGGAAYNCQAGSSCLTWQRGDVRKSGSRLNDQTCYNIRAGVQFWFAGAGSSFSVANAFGAATDNDNGQELDRVAMWSSGEIAFQAVSNGAALNSLSAAPSAVASSPCVIENGNLYFIGGYSSSVRASSQRLPGI